MLFAQEFRPFRIEGGDVFPERMQLLLMSTKLFGAVGTA